MSVYTEAIVGSGAAITLTSGLGYKKMTVRNRIASTTNCTILGNGAFSGRTASAIVLAPGDSIDLTDNINNFNNIVITPATGCTIDLALSEN